MKKLMNFVVMITMALLVCSCGNNARQSGESKDNTETETQTETVVENEKYFTYKFLEKENPFFKNLASYKRDWVIIGGWDCDGLAVCYGDDGLSKYVLFDDEEDFYNDCVYEWAMSLKIAKELYKWNRVAYEECDVIDAENLMKFCLVSRLSNDTIITYYDREEGLFAFDKNNEMINKGDTIVEEEYKINKQSLSHVLGYVHCLPKCIDEYKNLEIVEIFKKTYYDLQDARIYAPEKGYGFRKYPIDKDKYGYDYVILYRIKEGEYKNVPGGVLGIKFGLNSPW